MFNLRPILPRYSTAWYVSFVLKYRKSLQALKQFNLKCHSYRLEILLCITAGQRDQTLFYKAEKVGIIWNQWVVLSYPDQKICVVNHLEQDIELRRQKDQDLLICFVKSHKSITTSTSLGGV